MRPWLRTSTWWDIQGHQGVLGVTGPSYSFAVRETETYPEQTFPHEGDDLKECGWQYNVEIQRMVGSLICHLPLQKDSQAAVVHIALCFRQDILMDEAWKWDWLLLL